MIAPSLCQPSRVAVLAIFFGLCLSDGRLYAEQPIDFNRDIRPIVSGVCVACHGPDEAAREAGLRLDTREGAIEDLGGYSAVVPGDASASELLARITSDDDDLRMPPPGKGRALTKEEVELLRRWIDSGAEYSKHWSYVPPRREPLPIVTQQDWGHGAIDRFVLAKLEENHLAPTAEADRHTLARRVAMVLTGLPPSESEVAEYLADQAENAYERFVDAQLRKPSFGERWARVWLDLARYADSAGYADDPARTIWSYRDYVIRSLNENKPFDQFTIEQLAGDLLDSPTEQQLVATAFHRNTMTNNEGGTNDEQFRNEAVVDRVNTTFAVWMGTTMACAQCHTHKYDPITHDEYFQIFDFFNQSEDADRRNESPVLELWSDDQREHKRQLREQIDSLQRTLDNRTPELESAFEAWLAQLREPPAWYSLVPNDAKYAEGTLRVDEAGFVHLDGERPDKATYSISIPFSDAVNVRAVQVQVPETQASNFVLSRVSGRFVPKNAQPTMARFVRLIVPGENRFLHTAELQIFSGGVNVALTGTATQSSTAYNAEAGRAIDGNTDGDFKAQSVTHTDGEKDPWLEVDLGQPTAIDSVVVWNRTDGDASIGNRMKGFELEFLDAERKAVLRVRPDGVPAPSLSADVSGTKILKFVSAAADFAQASFPAEATLAGTNQGGLPADDKGWAIAGGMGQPHELTLFLDTVMELRDGTLVLELDQVSKFGQHVLTSLRLATTDDPRADVWAAMPADVRTLVGKAALVETEQQKIFDYFRSTTPLLESTRTKLVTAKNELEAMKPGTSVPVMKELEASKLRDSFVQIRGNYQSLGNKVSANVPAAFPPLKDDQPRNRLGLAKWLVDADNPLTARVLVNRHWEQVFGTGLVETSEEFGSQGELPSHPALLDWLAVDFIESGWDVKQLLKQMVMSATYRQSSEVNAALLERDPVNRLLGRGPRFRVSAEMVRDQSLAVAGLLSDKMYGAPVRPPQPSMGLSAAFGSGTDWQTSSGEDRYRRGIYTTWRRSNPYPSMATFDAPNREVCTLRRSRTNTPLQALVTMNDPVFVEAAQGLARRMAAMEFVEMQVARGIQLALSRDAKEAEVERLVSLYNQLVEHYADDSDAARAMAEEPLGKLNDHADPIQLAALTVVANVILNLDEFLMPR